MRKETNLIKNILFFSIIIISIIFVVTGCNNENFNPNEQTEVYKLRKLNQKQINSTLDLQSFIDKISIKKTNKQTERLLQIDSLGFKLNTEIVSLIEGPNGYKSYSFFISRDSMVENKIENLVLIKEGYNEYKSYLVTYDFTLEEYLNLKESSFENKDNIVKPLNFDISIFQDDELGKVVYAGRYIYIDCETEEWHWTGIRGEGYYVYTDCTIHHSGGGGGDDNSGTNDNYYIPDGYNEETNTYYNPRSGGENNGYNTGQSAYVFSPTVPTLEPWALVDFILGNSNNPNYTIEMRNWLENQRMASEEINTFLQNNNNSPEAVNFAIQAIEALMINTAMTFNQILSEQIATTVNIVNNIENNATNDAIELYLLAKYNNSDTLNLSVCARGSNTQTVGEYTLTPHYDSMDSNANLVFYAAYRNDTNGIEYIIKASDLTKFQEKIAWYTYAADLVYMNGVPSQGQIAYAAGDYFKGLYLMWSDALHSPQWWSYAITSFGTAIANLPVNSTVASLETTPNWNVSLNEMTTDLFQGKVVTNPQGVSVTINIPENYVPRIANNGQGIVFQPENLPIGSATDAFVIRMGQPRTQNPNGYVVFHNQYGQPINPLTNQTLPPSNWHFDF